MPGMLSSFASYEMKTSIIKVFAYDNKLMVGSLSNPFFPGEIYFQNLSQLLFIIDSLQNELDYPQKSMETRTFDRDKTDTFDFTKTPAPASTAVRATFALKLLFRQNASWQGTIAWIEEKRETAFRSALEMIMLMDSVLESL